MRPWITLESRYVLTQKWLKVREDHVRLPGGVELEDYYVIEYPDWVCVVCLTETGQVVLVEQYRHGVQRTTLELPAGTVDEGEDPLLAARRELLEETGYVADAWTSLGHCAPDPSKHTHYAHLFVASDARRVREQRLDASEVIAIRLVEPDEVLRLADSGEIVHGIHLSALLWARHRGLLVPEGEGQ
ncbi:MAG: NUDIX hydrolase [Rhodothermales bacterium]